MAGRAQQTDVSKGEVLLYRAEDGTSAVRVILDRDNVWLNQYQLAELFGRERSVIAKHIRNIFAESELKAKAVCAKFAQTAPDGKTYQVDHYNLDLIISVGYRVNSKRGTRFRIWATQTLKEHLTRGYTLNRQRFEQNARELETALQLVRKAAAGDALTTDQGRGLVDVIARYTQTFLLAKRARCLDRSAKRRLNPFSATWNKAYLASRPIPASSQRPRGTRPAAEDGAPAPVVYGCNKRQPGRGRTGLSFRVRGPARLRAQPATLMVLSLLEFQS